MAAVNVGDLGCVVVVEKDLFYKDRMFTFRVILENRGEPVMIFTPISWGYRGFFVELVDGQGISILPPINDFRPPPPQSFNDEGNFVRLSKGMILGERKIFSMKEFFPSSGVFQMHVGYLSPVPRGYSKIPGVVCMEDGVVWAPGVKVNVG